MLEIRTLEAVPAQRVSPESTAVPVVADGKHETAGGPTVIYLAGHGRCGSTVVGKVLGNLERTAYVGELNFFWSDGVLGNRPCGCGRSLVECRKWSGVLARLGRNRNDAAQLVTELMGRTTRLRHGVLALSAPLARRQQTQIDELASHIDTLYRTIAAEFDVDVLIDSSKSPMYERVLEAAPSVTVETIHLTRDPRAAAHSWKRPKSEPVGGSVLPTIGMVHSAVEWTAINLLAGRSTRTATGPSVRIRYEDLMSRPAAEFTAMGGALGRDFSGLGIADDGSVTIATSHSVAGNPDRFQDGPITLRPDRRWVDNSTLRERWVVTALTMPALSSLGYPIRVRS